MGADAFAQIGLRGMNAIDLTHIPCGQKSKSDLHGQRGYVGAFWYKTAMIENDGRMAVAYVGNLTITG
jgi:hypothetical protein